MPKNPKFSQKDTIFGKSILAKAKQSKAKLVFPKSESKAKQSFAFGLSKLTKSKAKQSKAKQSDSPAVGTF